LVINLAYSEPVSESLTRISSTTYSYTHTVLGLVGDVAVTVEGAKDLAGNASETAPSNMLGFTVDEAAPPAAPTILTVPSAINSANQTAVAFSGTSVANLVIGFLAEDESDPVRFVGGQVSANGTGEYSVLTDLSSLADGNLTLSVWAEEDGVRSATTSRSLVKDTVVSDLNYASSVPVNGVMSSSTPLVVTVLASEQLADCRLFIRPEEGMESTEWLMPVFVESGSALTVSQSLLAQGWHYYRVECTDVAGNTGILPEYSYYLDSVSPELEESEAAPAISNNNAPVYTFVSSESGQVLGSGGGCQVASQIMLEGENIISLGTLPDGSYANCELSVADDLGNVAVLPITPFIIDTQAPAIAVMRYRLVGELFDRLATGTAGNFTLSIGEAEVFDYLEVDLVDENITYDSFGLNKDGVLLGNFVWQASSTYRLVNPDHTELALGVNSLTIHFADAAGNTGSATVSVRVSFNHLGVDLVLSEGENPSAVTAVTVENGAVIAVGASQIILEPGTVITRTDGLSFDVASLSADLADIAGLGGLSSGLDLIGALRWGLDGLGLSFSQPVTIRINVGSAWNGKTLRVMRSVTGQDSWTDDGIASPKSCLVAGGFCQFAITKASYFAAIQQLNSGGGSGYLPLTPCRVAEYGPWGACVGGWQYRNIVSSLPLACTITKKQLEEAGRACGSLPGNQVLPEEAVEGIKIFADGVLLRSPSMRIYVMQSGVPVHIRSLSELRATYAGQKIYQVSDEQLVSMLPKPQLVRTADKRIYVFDGQSLRYVPSLEQLRVSYFSWPIFSVGEEFVDKYR
jgi:hypothetical protein